MNTIETDKLRLDYLDIAKAISIISVLFVHCIDPEGVTPFWAKLLASFNMPLFFTVCGITTRGKEQYSGKDFLRFLGENAFALILPYFIWGLIYTPFTLDSMGRLLYGSCEVFISAGGAINHFWFLPCLFLARLAMYGILVLEQRITRHRKIILTLLSAVSFAIGFLLPRLPNGYPWCCNIVFVALGFMILSHMNRDYLNKMDQRSAWLQVGLAIGSAVLLWVGNAYGSTDLPRFMSMCTSEYGNVFWFLFNSIAGIMCARSVSTLIARIRIHSRFAWIKKAMTWLGRNTMGIFIIHKPFGVTYIVGAVAAALHRSPSCFAVAVVAAPAMLAFSTVVTLCINRVCPELLGHRRKQSSALPKDETPSHV